MFCFSPVTQDQSYHAFADQRALIGVTRFADVATNLPFIVAGIAGLMCCRAGRSGRSWRSWSVFFAGVALTGLGSAYYHADPTDRTLVWDRLPMTIGFTGILVAVLSERISRRIETEGLATAVFAGIVSVLWWAAVGDLRPYIVVQLMPLTVIPAAVLLYPGQRRDDRFIMLSLALYALAKVFEQYDHALFAATGQVVSGHSLKHLSASFGCAAIAAMLRNRTYSRLEKTAFSAAPMQKRAELQKIRARVSRLFLHRSRSKAVSLLVVLSLLSLSAGCGPRSFKDELATGSPGRQVKIAVVPVIMEPQYEVLTAGQRTVKHNKTGPYAVNGAGGGAYVGLGIASLCGPFMPLCALFFVPVGCLIGGVGGAIAGATHDISAAAPDKTTTDLKKIATEALKTQERAFPELVAERVVAAEQKDERYALHLYPPRPSLDWKPIYSAADDKAPKKSLHADLKASVDLVLEVRVEKIGLVYDFKRFHHVTFFDVRSRLLQPENWVASLELKHRYFAAGDSTRWPADKWSEVMTSAAGPIGEAVRESLFFDSGRLPAERTWDKHHCVLRPITPATMEGPNLIVGHQADAASDSLSPTLIWEALPRMRAGVSESAGGTDGIGKVTYDVRVWKRSRDNMPGALVYERTGLDPETGEGEVDLAEKYMDENGRDLVRTRTVGGIRTALHAVDVKLDPDTEYLWSVRARYQGRDGEGVTTWSRYRMKEYPDDACDANIIAPHAFYSFSAPTVLVVR